MFHDDEIDEVFLEFRRLSRRLGGSSTPIIRDIIRSIKRATNEIRRSHWRVEDGRTDGVADEASGGRFGGRQSRERNTLLGHEVLSVGVTGKGSRSEIFRSTIDMVSDRCAQVSIPLLGLLSTTIACIESGKGMRLVKQSPRIRGTQETIECSKIKIYQVWVVKNGDHIKRWEGG